MKKAPEVAIVEVRPGVFSVLLGTRSITVFTAPHGEDVEAAAEDGPPQIVAVRDARDRVEPVDGAAAKGPVTLRAQMPGKIIKLLASVGDSVEAGQGLLVVEAMKMQNEVKAPKAGTIRKMQVSEGATVAAGETLLVVE